MVENTTAVTTVTATDSDVPAQTLTYSISGGADAAKFSINGVSGALTFVTAPNYESPTDVGGNNVYDVTVQVSDGNGGTDSVAIAVTVTAGNEGPTFTTGAGTGKVTTNVSSFWDGASATLIQPDGKIVVAGSMNNGSTVEPYVARYNADGTLDPSFGPAGNGIYSFSIQPSNDGLYAMALQSDGKILVAGYAHNGMNNDFAIVRFNTDGSLDTTFDSDGIRLIDIAGGDDSAQGIAVQSDGKIVVGGVAAVVGNNDFAAIRLNADGSLDTTFDTDGKVTTAIGAGADEARGLAIQPDGRIVLAGYSHNGTNEDVALVRYNTDGSLDTGFDSDGKRTVAVGSGYDVANAVALQADGKIVVAGDSLISGTPDFTLLRYNADGSLDTSFDTDGMATTAVGGSSDYSKALVIQSDGRIVVVGESFNGSNNDIALARYNSDGSLDTTFDTDGKLTTAIGPSIDNASGVAVQSDGKIVVAGFAQFADGYTALVRYNTNGSLDTTFGATSTLNGAPTYVENGAPVVLDADVQVTDPELGAAGNYSGATLTLSRHGGANSLDTFSATGNLSALTQGGNLVLSGVTIGTVTTNSAGTLLLTFNGNATQARVNETLRSIAYANSSNAPPASAQINWTFSDGNSGAQGPGGPFVATGSTAVTITAVNDAPFMPGVALGSTSEDSTWTMSASTLAGYSSDPDTGALKGVAIVGVDNTNGTWQYTLNGTDWFNIGAVATNNALLLAADATSAFRFVPNANWNGTTGMLQYKAWDQTSGTAGTYADASVSGGTTAFSGTSGSTVQVTAVNDAPVLGFTGSISIPPTNEDTPSPPCPVSDLLFSAMRTDVDAGALSGIAVTSATGKGVFQYSTDGVTWTDFGTVSASNALLLTNTTQVRYQPDGKNGETGPFPQFTFIAWDRTSGSASANGSPQYANPGTGGGTSAYSSQNATAMIWVDSVNDAPAGTDKTIVAAQNTAYTFAAADFGFTDPVDGPAHSLSAVKITTLPGSGSLTLNGAAVAAGDLVSAADIAAGKLIYTPAAGANGAGLAAFTFQVKDSGGTANGGVDLDPTPNTMTIDVAGIRIVAVSPQVAVGDEVRVNTTAAGVQRVNSTAPQAVARDAAGNTVVVWTSADQDGSFDGVYAQRYDAAGNAVGAEFQVNTTTIQTQSLAAVAMAPNGDFVITWSDASADGGAYGVYAQRYNAAGVAQGGEFRVNSTTANNQYYSSVAMDRFRQLRHRLGKFQSGRLRLRHLRPTLQRGGGGRGRRVPGQYHHQRRPDHVPRWRWMRPAISWSPG